MYAYQHNQLELIKGEELPEIRELDFNLINDALEKNQTEVWTEETIGDKKFRTFYFIYETNEPIQIISVSIQEKSLILIIFNLFKLTLVHIIISAIILLLGTLILFIKQYKFKLKFKTRLFIGLFVVTLIPIILLAYITRESEMQRWKDNLSRELKKDLDIITIYFNETSRGGNSNFSEIQNITQKLGIDFNIYKNSELILSSQKNYMILASFLIHCQQKFMMI